MKDEAERGRGEALGEPEWRPEWRRPDPKIPEEQERAEREEFDKKMAELGKLSTEQLQAKQKEFLDKLVQHTIEHGDETEEGARYKEEMLNIMLALRKKEK